MHPNQYEYFFLLRCWRNFFFKYMTIKNLSSIWEWSTVLLSQCTSCSELMMRATNHIHSKLEHCLQLYWLPTLLHIQNNYVRNINYALLKIFSVWKNFNFWWNSNINMHFTPKIYNETLIMAWVSYLENHD